MTRTLSIVAALLATLFLASGQACASEVRIKDLGRFMGWRQNVLVGYGVVVGLAGSGDSPRNATTRQALTNVLNRMGLHVTPEDVASRNVAVVMVTATLPPAANVGDRLDVSVSSIGDARSLAGGTLLMTPLLGADQRPYAVAQGALVVGGYSFEANSNIQQKNYPTGGVIPGGASVETGVTADLVNGDGQMTFILKDADATTAVRIADRINADLGPGAARVRGADAVVINAAPWRVDPFRLVARVENLTVQPSDLGRVVVNERSGTVVAGSEVQISSVVISQGDIRVSVTIENEPSQPLLTNAEGARSLIVTNTRLSVRQPQRDAVIRFPNTTVGDLVEGLQRLHVETREIIGILQALKAAGALHAEIIVQ